MTDQLELHSLKWDECVYFQEVGVCMDAISFQDVALLTDMVYDVFKFHILERKENLTLWVC